MLSFQTFLYLGLTFFIGALIGYLLCFFSNRNKDKSRMEDELTKAKRELYTQKRMLADFFNTSNTLFEQLESSYQAYSSHMNEHARKMFPMLGDMYVTSKHNFYATPNTMQSKATAQAPNTFAEEVEVQEVPPHDLNDLYVAQGASETGSADAKENKQ